MSSKSWEGVRILPKKLIFFSASFFTKLASLFISLKIKPNAISLMALITGIGAGFLFYFKEPLGAGVLIAFCGVLDIMDGKVALMTKKQSLFGAWFDSTLDRYSEFFIYLGLGLYFWNSWTLWLVFCAFLGSTMVSYTRARAEGLGIECRIGVMQRAERIILLSFGSILGGALKIFNPVMTAVLAAIAFFSNLTAIQRIFYIKKIEKIKK